MEVIMTKLGIIGAMQVEVEILLGQMEKKPAGWRIRLPAP